MDLTRPPPSFTGVHPHHRRSRRLAWVLSAVLAAIAGTTTALAQGDASPRLVGPASARAQDDRVEPFPLPELAPAARTLIDQPYHTAEELAALRVKHGVWDEADLASPVLRARAALTRGAWTDPSLSDPQADLLDRAEAARLRGDAEQALAMLEDAAPGQTLRGVRIRAEALLDVGRRDDAATLLDEALPRATSPDLTDADEIVEGVRGMILRARLRGPEGPSGDDFRAMMARLAAAREQRDALSWRAPLVEAMLLYEKDNFAQTGEALEQALSMNPRLAAGWALLGRLAVDGFDVERSEAIAARLDDLAGGPSADGAQVRAAMRLRQAEGESAQAALAPALAQQPRNRSLLAMQAASVAGSFDFTEAQAALDRLDAIAPGTPEGVLAVGRALAQLRQYDEAATYLRRAVERAPKWPEPLIELGLSELQAGRLPEAREALEAAATMDRFNTRAANSLTLLRELAEYAELTSDHFIVRYKPGVDEILAREMLPVLERIFARVTGPERGGIDHVPQGRTVVELYPNHRWFSVRITGMPRLHTIAAATGPVIAMEAPRDGPGHIAGPYDWARVVQHEYTHTVTLSRTRNRLPHWFTEASAVYLEDAPRDWSTIQMLARAVDTQTLFDFETINVMFVRPRRPIDRALAYAQGAWMYEYMIERFGGRSVLELMDLYATGVREPEAFERVLGTSRETFLEAFTTWATQQLVSWGVRLPEGVPTINELLAQAAGEDGQPPEPTRELVTGFLERHPNHPQLLRVMVDLELRERGGQPAPEMKSLLEAYAAACPVDPMPHRHLAALALQASGGDAARAAPAISHLEFLDAREQNSPQYAMELARLYAAQGDFTRAQAKADRAAGVAPYEPRVREYAATVALRAGDLARAERHIRALVAIEPDRELHRQRLEAVLRRAAGTPDPR